MIFLMRTMDTRAQDICTLTQDAESVSCDFDKDKMKNPGVDSLLDLSFSRIRKGWRDGEMESKNEHP